MKAITRYQADDGSEFRTAEDAAAHDVLCVKIAEAMKPLGERPKQPACAFENGQLGYIQHDVETVDGVARTLIELAKPYLPSLADMLVWKNVVHPSHPSRAISEGPQVLWKAWFRIESIDSMGREFGQPYFKNNPGDCSAECCLDMRRGAKPVDGATVPSFRRGL